MKNEIFLNNWFNSLDFFQLEKIYNTSLFGLSFEDMNKNLDEIYEDFYLNTLEEKRNFYKTYKNIKA